MPNARALPPLPLVYGIAHTLLLAYLLVHLVEERKQLLVDIHRHVAAEHLYIGVVLDVVYIEVERHMARIAAQHRLQVGHARVGKERRVDIYGKLVYRLVFYIAQELYLLYHQIVGIGVVAEALLTLAVM